jgi:hypothetical protein
LSRLLIHDWKLEAAKELTLLASFNAIISFLQLNIENGKEDENVEEEDDYPVREEDIIRPVSPSKYRLRFKKVFASKYEDRMQQREDKKREAAEEIEREEAHQEYLVKIGSKVM